MRSHDGDGGGDDDDDDDDDGLDVDRGGLCTCRKHDANGSLGGAHSYDAPPLCARRGWRCSFQMVAGEGFMADCKQQCTMNEK